MWHTIEFVAESRRQDAKAIETFATSAGDNFGPVSDRRAIEVNTWHVDMLVKDFIAAASLVDAWQGGPAMPSPDRLGLASGRLVHVVYDSPNPGHAYRGEGVFVRHLAKGKCGGQWDAFIEQAPHCVVEVPGNPLACFPLACVCMKKG